MVTVGSILRGTFAFVRANGRAIAVWSAIVFLCSIASMFLMRPYYEAQVAALQEGLPPTPHFWPVFGLLLLLTLAFIVLWAAAFRAVLFPEERAYAYLRLGMDELRLLGVVLAVFVGGYLVFLVLCVLVGIVTGLLAVTLGATAGVIVGLVLGLTLLGFGLWAAVRVSPCGPLTIFQRKVVIGPAWRLTRGAFWRLFGAYVVVWIAFFLIYLVVLVIQMGPELGDMLHPTDPEATMRVAQYQLANYGDGGPSLRMLLTALIGGIVGGAMLAFHAGMNAVATVQLLDSRADPAAL